MRRRVARSRTRAALCALVVAGTGAAAAGCPATVPDGFGPFGRGSPPVRASIGKGHVLTWRRPLVPELQADPRRAGRALAGEREGEVRPGDERTVLTDRSGRFRFEGPYPAAYEGAPPHIHLRVVASGHEVLLSRYVPARGARRGRSGSCWCRRRSRRRSLGARSYTTRTASTAARATSKAPHAIAATDHGRPKPPAASGQTKETSPR